MKPARHLSLLVLASLMCTSVASAQSADETRLRGFAKHQKEREQFEKARVQGERGYLEEDDQWEAQKSRELQAYKSQKLEIKMNEDGPEAKADALVKRNYEQEYEKSRRNYAQTDRSETDESRLRKGLPSESQEYGLDSDLPRYDYRKRPSFGAASKYRSAPLGSGSSSSGGGQSFPPPPTFDDFNDGGYVPAPSMPDDFGDVPPPPPPPSFGDDGGFMDGDFPPPPPPPIFEGGSDF